MLENAGFVEDRTTLADVLQASDKHAAITDLLQHGYESQIFRNLESSYGYIFGNDTDVDDFTSNLRPASDVSVSAFKASVAFNLVVFLVLMASYETLRRLFPSVYAARKARVRACKDEGASAASLDTRASSVAPADSTEDVLENSVMPLAWISPVFGISWATVRKVAGLDGYFFLRYIRMCLRITAISTFWSLILLIPTFATGGAGAVSWYHLSMLNIPNGTWRTWVPVVFMYLFSAFCFFVMKQEYRHFIELRMYFLGKGDSNINPQHHYSLAVDNIPIELRSDRALFDYFNRLFPGKVHSACVVLNLPDLEALVARRLRIVRRLEKSIAYFHATGERPTHVVGRSRAACCGIDLSPCDCNWNVDVRVVNINGPAPEKGTRVDSISYYTHELAEANKNVSMMQKRKTEVAESGNASSRAFDWLAQVADWTGLTAAAATIMEDSVEDNALLSPHDVSDAVHDSMVLNGSLIPIPQAERMTSMYGSFAPIAFPTEGETSRKKSSLGAITELESRSESWPTASIDSDSKSRPLITGGSMDSVEEDEGRFVAPGGREKERGFIRRLAGRLGLDFLVAGLRYLNGQFDVAVESVVGSTMSSSGLVTFLDLVSITTAACTPLTNKPNLLVVSVAPEPRDIQWANVQVDTRVARRKEQTANVLLFFGVILWSFPLAAIQAFATAEQLARIPGMQWILTFNSGSLSAFINGYLPVLALLGLILLLPIMFERIALNYERRRTYSGIQRSILTRYFYYQLANIYITVTAGSLWTSLADIIERPSNVLELLGESLPTVNGYFVSLLVTKTLAGLPIVFLRVGALGRMLFLRTFFSEKKLTQRELDAVYRPENVMYGWEFPTQLLVIVICFTYACICPIILPFGATFFGFALLVYKKQLLYVYTPVYESGGELFPVVCQQTLYGLVCGQLTFIGYALFRGCRFEPLFLVPLPILTIWVMGYFHQNFALPSKQLSMERAKECDRVSDARAACRRGTRNARGQGVVERREQFDKSAYRQPVLTLQALEPMSYRANQPDPITEETNVRLRSVNRYLYMSDSARGEGLRNSGRELGLHASGRAFQTAGDVV